MFNNYKAYKELEAEKTHIESLAELYRDLKAIVHKDKTPKNQ